MGGVPTYWRTLTGDSWSKTKGATVYRSFDILSPWTVGRYSDNASADWFRDNLIVPDMTEAAANGIEYMPVVFPGFSWYNLNQGPLNQIPRNGGHFFWRQIYNTLSSGARMLYVAMFDEVDEGTAMFKLAPTRQELPVGPAWGPLDIDGYRLPSDWSLQLGGQASKMMRGEIPLSPFMPISPVARGLLANIEMSSPGRLPVVLAIGSGNGHSKEGAINDSIIRRGRSSEGPAPPMSHDCAASNSCLQGD